MRIVCACLFLFMPIVKQDFKLTDLCTELRMKWK
jgi:hypothetical protein